MLKPFLLLFFNARDVLGAFRAALRAGALISPSQKDPLARANRAGERESPNSRRVNFARLRPVRNFDIQGRAGGYETVGIDLERDIGAILPAEKEGDPFGICSAGVRQSREYAIRR
jgi:hypothetical protein